MSFCGKRNEKIMKSSQPTAQATLGVQSLSERRVTLCTNFAKKALKHEKYKTWFYPASARSSTKPETRFPEPQLKFKNVQCRTSRYEDSPIPYLTRLLYEALLIHTFCVISLARAL